MNAPPTFPRIALLDATPGASFDDLVLSRAERRAWFGPPVVVEEKLDGANVAIWINDAGLPRVVGRGGVGAMDRAGQLGRLRAWAAERNPALTALLSPDEVLYGEWLYLEHSVRYDLLPDWLVVLDLWSQRKGFSSARERDVRCSAAGLVCAPVLYHGVIGSPDDLMRLTPRSRFGVQPMEGLVLRRESEGRLIDRVKWLRPGFTRLGDSAWARGRPTNSLDPAFAVTRARP